MASGPKKPRLEGPTDRPRPRLLANERRCAQQFLIDAHRQTSTLFVFSDRPTPLFRSLFISQAFFNAYFESEDFGTVSISIESATSISLAKFKPSHRVIGNSKSSFSSASTGPKC
ncbi:hypothetical protein M3Y99_01651200 [Aphelenchoides fujianensis]|nr:hypothetical protein M3Y99_01651200 [Aphelenchoides fujianensis]